MSWNKFRFVSRRSTFAVILSLCLFLIYGCSLPDFSGQSLADFDLPLIGDLGDDLVEVSPPELIQALKARLDVSEPKVSILEPRNDETFDADSVSVKLSVSGLKLFKDKDLGLGPHISLVLDDQDPVDVFDVARPVSFDHLRPGTHTLRAIAEYPWNESFKDPTAYAQVSFNVLTASNANSVGQLPVLTTSALRKTYTAEPMLLDFVVRGAQSSANKTSSSQVKVNVNGESFLVDAADANIYLSGLKTGQNWIKLELQDDKGHLNSTPFSEQLFAFEFNPEQTSALGNLLAEKVTFDAVGGVVGIAKPKPPAPAVPAKSPSTPPALKPVSPSTTSVKPVTPSAAKNITEGAKPSTSAIKKVTPPNVPTAPAPNLKPSPSTSPTKVNTPDRTTLPKTAVSPSAVAKPANTTPEKRATTLPTATLQKSSPLEKKNAVSSQSDDSKKTLPNSPKETSLSSAKKDDATKPEAKPQPTSPIGTPISKKEAGQDVMTQIRAMGDQKKTQMNQSLNSWRDRLNQVSGKSSISETHPSRLSESSGSDSKTQQSPTTQEKSADVKILKES